MDDKNLHINQQPDGQYPKPDISVDDAWKAMDKMLTEQLSPLSDKTDRSGSSRINRFIKIILIISIIGGMVYVGTNSLSKKTITSDRDEMINTQFEDFVIDSIKQLADKNISNGKNNLYKSDYNLGNNLPDSAKTGAQSLIKHSANNHAVESKLEIHPTSKENINTSFDRGAADKLNHVNNEKRVDKRNNLKAVVNSNKENNNNSEQNFLYAGNIDSAVAIPKNDTVDVKKVDKLVKTESVSIVRSSVSLINSGDLLSKKTVTPHNILQNKRKNSKERFFSNINYGLQLNAGIPLNSECFCEYFADARHQSWKFFIPGVWVGKTLVPRHTITLQFNPYQQYFTGDKILRSQTFYLPPGLPEDSLRASRTTNLIKTAGLSAGVQYAYAIDNKWSVGIGVDYKRQANALLSEEVKRLQDGKIFYYSTYGDRNLRDTSYLNRYFFTGNLNVMYNFKRFQAGIGIQKPFTNLSQVYSIRAINGQLYLRWRLK